MAKPLFPKSVRKHIRFQKARIRRENSDPSRQEELIAELYNELRERYGKKEKQEKPRRAPKQELVGAAKAK